MVLITFGEMLSMPFMNAYWFREPRVRTGAPMRRFLQLLFYRADIRPAYGWSDCGAVWVFCLMVVVGIVGVIMEFLFLF